MVTSAMNSADDDRKTRVTLDSKLPDKRARLLQNINSLGAPVTDGVKTSNLPFAQLAIDNRRCDGCRICTTFCPTGALSCFDQEGRQIIAFRIDYCLDCKLCSDICPRDAITFSGNISPNSILSTHWRSLVAHPTSACIKCGQTYITMAGTNLCLSCRKRKEQEEWIVNRLQPRQEK